MAIVKTMTTGANATGSVQTMMVITGMDADITLTKQQAADVGIFDITATAAKKLIFPTAIAGKVIIVHNRTAATHGVTVTVDDSSGVAVAATKTAILRCTEAGAAEDFVRVTADV